MNGNNSVLAVVLGEKLIAYLSLEGEYLIWKYTADWQKEGFAVSPHLPLSDNIPAITTTRFLRNLLPEGYAFDELLQNLHVSRNNTFALIRALGLDIPGALIFKQPETQIPEQGTFRLLTEKELIERLDERDIRSLVIWDGKPRLSVAGIQDKINLMITSQGQLGFGEGALCSTHILKFERQKQSHLVVNEYLTMRLAKQCGLNVANAALQQYGNHHALLVERFDRKLINDNQVKRRHVIDGCQALNLPPEYKYERNYGSNRDVAHIRDGASLPLLFAFADRCQNPAVTRQQMLDWVLFNILVYNLDAHGKNISFYVNSQGISLTPLYDLINVRLYPDMEQELAMALGDEFDSDNINAYQIADFADSCQLQRRYVAKRLKQLIIKMMAVLPEEIASINEQFGYITYFNQYQQIVASRCEHLIKQCSDIITVTL
ncbi:HipA domain-containing protein [Legionella dresdenensis]|uniref:HipA domain-containing protein n=1 Tax=Legionella dresdenensis TaxID=450200 RepID=A0ABV8CG73_9GAMM